MRDPSGAAAFARYAFPPNDLGHCGPPGAEVLLAVGAGAPGTSAPGSPPAGPAHPASGRLRDRASRFDGAWPYLRLLAGAAGTDELDASVVATYWLGGPLLDGVDEGSFKDVVRRHFGGQPGVLDRLAVEPGAWSTGPNHAFHVFVVYPWVGLLGTAGKVAISVLERCRVRPGVVASVDGEQVTVVSRPLRAVDGRLEIGPETVETARWSRGEHAFVQGLQPGEAVALHWDWVCDRLDPVQVADLESVTWQQLESTNRWLTRAGRRPS